MPVTPGPAALPDPDYIPESAPNGFGDESGNNVPFPGMQRYLYLTDRDGVEHKINSPADLEKILAQMTPEELQRWKDQYRFAPVENDTGIQDYTGVPKDL